MTNKQFIKNEISEIEILNTKHDKVTNVSVKTGHAVGQLFLVRLA